MAGTACMRCIVSSTQLWKHMLCSYQVPCVPLIVWCFEGQLGSISYGCLPGTATVFVAVASCRKPKAGGFLTQALCSEGGCPACGNTSA
jgi:hypothetical protein